MNTRQKPLLAFLVVLLLLVSTAFTPAAQTGPVYGPNGRVQGLSAAEWSVLYWQYDFSLPKSVNPATIEPSSDCLVPMFGNVALLLGSSQVNTVDCTVPAGTSIFVPLVAIECSNLEEAPYGGKNEEELRRCVNAFHFTNLTATLDSVDIPNLERYEGTSPLYNFTLPNNNIFDLPAGTIGQSMSRGIFLTLRPLPEGNHALDLTGSIPEAEFSVDITININVVAPDQGS